MEVRNKEYVERILKDYSEKEVTKLEELKMLDKKAKKGANIFAYVFGIIGSLVLGFGMCVAMKVILAELMWVGILIGLVGILMVSLNYIIYTKMLSKSKKKYANEILELSNQLLDEVE